jgi:hypothetical protein
LLPGVDELFQFPVTMIHNNANVTSPTAPTDKCATIKLTKLPRIFDIIYTVPCAYNNSYIPTYVKKHN